MSVKKEASGRRSVQIEFKVPGTPEEVLQDAWFQERFPMPA